MGGVLRGDLGLPENGEVCFEGSSTYFVYSLKMNWTHFAQKKRHLAKEEHLVPTLSSSILALSGCNSGKR
jgi:hypothetical protein